MTFLIRRRYYFWLFKAYVKKWKKTIFSSLILGVFLFFTTVFFLNLYLKPLLDRKVEKIGFAGAYTPSNLPETVLGDLSYGLTKVEANGEIKGDAATKWEVKNGEKEYVFYLKKGQFFHSGEELTADTLNLNFKDVTKKKLGKYIVSYTLKGPYSPFIVSVSKPIFLNGFSGLGAYKLKKLKLNAGFAKTIVIQNTSDKNRRKIIYFYPTKKALKISFMLGEVDRIVGVNNLKVNNYDLSSWKNLEVKPSTNYGELVTLFYNNSDEFLSNKKIRQALNYALPSSFEFGERVYSPILPVSVYFQRVPNYGISDKEIAKTLLSSSNVSINKELEISTTEEFYDLAKVVQNSWGKIGVKTRIKIVDDIPSHFQIFLYKFRLPKDPDQYTLWHSDQVNNIIHYKNLRIDKLLEDGRLTTDINKRISIYSDFQKYLLDDAPAGFLYFPREFILVRK